MWFGTWDGLNAYDGRNFKIYMPEPGNPQAISNNIIRETVEEKEGFIWIATDCGINRLDVDKSKFSQFYFGYEKTYPALPNVFHIAKNNENKIICAVLNWGIAYFDEKSEEFIALNSPFINTMDIKEIKIDMNNRLWILHLNGKLEIVEQEKQHNGKLTLVPSLTLDLPPVRSIYNSGEYMAVVGDNKNLYIYTNLLRQTGKYSLKEYISSGEILYITVLNGMIYITVSTGGYYTMPENLSTPPVYSLHLQNTLINVLYKGRQEILWAGTDGSGITMIFNNTRPFQTVHPKKIFGAVRSFCEDRQKRLWIGSKGSGIAVMDSQFKLSAEYSTDNGLVNNSIYALTAAFDGDIFIGSDGTGLNVFTGNKMTKLDTGVMPFTFSGTYSIYCSEKTSTLWVGASEYGLIRMKIKKTNNGYQVVDYSQYLHDRNNPRSITNNTIYSILPENDSILWVGTRGGGLNKFHLLTETFESFQYDPQNPASLGNNDVISLCKDSHNRLWIGTSMGLNVMVRDRTGNIEFKKYSQSGGLPNNTVHGIMEDANRHIWVSTNKGLAKINPETDEIISCYENDGLQNNEFSDGACYKSLYDNNFFFGGIKGLNRFDPNKIRLRDYAPPFHIASFKIFNREENIGDWMVTGKNGVKQMVLDYNRNFFSFTFRAIDYINSEQCEYRYKLEGFDADWVIAGNTGVATYTKIKPGKYTLWVDYTNGDKVRVKEPYRLDILIKPPFWQTKLACVFYALCFLLLMYAIYLTVRKRMKETRKIFIERMERKEQENIYEAKFRFFTNIAHEFYTPITLIYGPCEKILEKSSGNEAIAKYVQIILSSAKRMKNLIGELMEYRKVETGHTDIIPEKVNISELLNSVGYNFSEIAEKNKIDYCLTPAETDIQWITDHDAVEKILFNLISNAFKYTPENGYIHVEYDMDERDGASWLVIRIINSGKGIKPENIHEIFDRFRILDNLENQIEKGYSGRNGIGLALTKSLVTLLNGSIRVESKVNQYTTFTVELPALKLPAATANPNISAIQPSALPLTVQLPSGKDGEPLIMIVDDEPEIRTLLRDTLEEHFPNIMEAANGEEALQQMKTKRPNLIICDVMMPEMDGIAFARELKSNVLTNHLPIIFLSARNSVDDKILAAECGSDVYISKPFHPRQILASVESLLVKHQLIQDYYTSSGSCYELLENGQMIHREDREWLMKIIHYIEENVEDESLSIDAVSNYMGMSNISLYRKLKTTINQTPRDLIKAVKLNKAAHLLTTTTITVQEVMYRSGFNNKSYFYQEFAKMYKVTPKEFREQKKNN